MTVSIYNPHPGLGLEVIRVIAKHGVTRLRFALGTWQMSTVLANHQNAELQWQLVVEKLLCKTNYTTSLALGRNVVAKLNVPASGRNESDPRRLRMSDEAKHSRFTVC